jgi:hypothetical protein
MNTFIETTTEQVRGASAPEVGNTVGVLFGLHRDDADLGIITDILAYNEDTGRYDVRVAWYASKKRRRARPENKRHNAARRVAIIDRMDAINQHYAEAN